MGRDTLSWEYLAGWFDGEGSAFRDTNTRTFILAFGNTDYEVIKSIRDFLNSKVAIVRRKIDLKRTPKGKPFYSFTIRAKNMVLPIAEELAPRCITKKAKLLEAIEHIRTHPNKWPYGERPHWSKEETAFLITNYRKLSQFQIAERLHKTPKAVVNAIHRKVLGEKY